MNATGQIRKTLILGLGNILMGDEGIGVESAIYLQGYEWPEGIDILDGGTGGFHLLSLFDDYDRFIFIDATLTEDKPGTVDIIRPRFASDFPRSLTSHDIGLRDLIHSAQMLGDLPEMYVITVSINDLRDVKMELSDAVRAALPKVREAVKMILENRS